MAQLHPSTPSSDSTYSARPSAYLNKLMQLNFSKKIFVMTMFSSLFALVPALYFINVNFNLIRELLPQTAPGILQHVEREQTFANILVVGLLLAQLSFLLIFSKRMTAQIVAPVQKVADHLKKLSRGHLAQPAVKIRDGDELQDFVAAYNYFYAGLKRHGEKQLSALVALRSRTQDPESIGYLDLMIRERREQLRILSPLTYEGSGTADDSRHVS